MTIHDLMMLAGVDGEPRWAYRDARPDEPPYVDGQTFDPESGETFTLVYDDGATTQTVTVAT
jgi:hypothetical protein